MKHLKIFGTEAELSKWRTSREFTYPNVCLLNRKLLYGVTELRGVFIQHIDGNLYTTDEWTVGGFTNDEANGVAVIGLPDTGIVISKEEIGYYQWGENRPSSSYIGHNLYGYGEKDTEDIINGLGDNNGVNYAAQMARNYIFPNGKTGFLPTKKECHYIVYYITEVIKALSLIGDSTGVFRTWTTNIGLYSGVFKVDYYSINAWGTQSITNTKPTRAVCYL